MNEQEVGKKITKLLDLGLDDIKQSTLNQLQSARRTSLENRRRVMTESSQQGQERQAQNGKIIARDGFEQADRWTFETIGADALAGQ